MLVKFSCKSYSNIIMFHDIASHMLKMMGHSTNIPGVIEAEDVPSALEHLQQSLKHESDLPEIESFEDDEDAMEHAVSLKNRALPLIELLSAASRDKCDVMWDKE
ncbi:DUF1840 domain-containing protein [Vibrio alfacsensis]|uniref:DUF1840 domain-containing protein n=1 Tax=Vibrio alfacsensis TaxID=1074311 RepID=A0ABN5PHQ6_9VIBR|nr:DUF1840 domain-containing protein [Vibrio alfacsensis]AXY02734.1 DUF1840 domain-containing protein [Vibrio alfacsensis]WQE77877.1 DUF1840 domain-containing protein [Vibrio alfacsensis]BBM66370.1 hypothetical protein VA249_30160 [Vibrio alfacsensis]BCN25766.1 hypothetical protein VYA_29580 [Vibrio alfacsensis]